MPKNKLNLYNFATGPMNISAVVDFFWEAEDDDDTIFPLEVANVSALSSIWELDSNDDFTLQDVSLGFSTDEALWVIDDDDSEVSPISVSDIEDLGYDPD